MMNIYPFSHCSPVPHSPTVVDIIRLVSLLHHESETVWECAMFTLRQIGLPAVEPLSAALHHPSDQARMLAAQLLGQIGDPSAIVPLSQVANDPCFEVREAARSALQKLIRIYIRSLSAARSVA